MTSLFDKQLTQMEREVRDLKTIHRRGLGETRFYRDSITISNAAQGTHTVQIHLAAGELTPAIISAHINTPTPTRTSNVRIYQRTYGADASIYTYTAGTIRVDVISSAEIEELTTS